MIRPLPMILLVFAACGALVETRALEEHVRVGVLVAVVGSGGVLAVLRGFDLPLGGVLWSCYGERRPWIGVIGAVTVLLCAWLAVRNADIRSEIAQASSVSRLRVDDSRSVFASADAVQVRSRA